ncbi:MAG: T9SS type A sorting domain-containing protein, partial [Saprospiraceae bacterium]
DITPGAGPYECDEQKTWTASAIDCSDQSVITWIGRLYDVNGNVVKEVETNSLTFTVTNKTSYYAEFWAYDGCGNSGGNKGEIIQFWDCKKPTPYVLNGVVVELGETGRTQVWAADLDKGSFDNCTDQANLNLSIWHENIGDAPTDLAGVQALPKVITLGCLEVGNQSVQIYAADEEGNWDYVKTYVLVQDNMNACSNNDPNGMSVVAGTIMNGFSQEVEFVTVAVNGAEQKTLTTKEDGQYQFLLPQGGDYTLTPVKDMNPLNGVSTFDLVLISKHILGTQPFDSPYKHIAADVNKSGGITAFDMVQLRQLILNITSEFPNNDSWRFVDGRFTFTTTNPAGEAFNEFVSINNLNANMESMDFTAVKIGDVNASGSANSLVAGESRTTNGTLNLNVTDRFVEVGQTVTVAFTAANIANTTGFQFTLNAAGTAEVVEGVAKAANFNTNLAERGLIAASWNGVATANDVLFALTFTANTTGLLSEMIEISSDVTAAEAYNNEGELLNVAINFNSTAIAAGFELTQNTPNPFSEETLIGFNLPTAGTATLKIMDVQGKVLKAITADYAKGYNTVSVNANELGATGVLYYQLEAADNIATKKMIIIE